LRCAADGVGGVVDGFSGRGKGAVGETGLTAGIAAAALGFLSDAFCLPGLLFMEPRVEVAPVAAFNRCRVVAITTRSYVPALRIHFTFLFRFALNSAGTPSSAVRCGRSSYNPSLAIKICALRRGKFVHPKGLAAKNVQTTELGAARKAL
jgi:hypothetical protein